MEDLKMILAVALIILGFFCTISYFADKYPDLQPHDCPSSNAGVETQYV